MAHPRSRKGESSRTTLVVGLLVAALLLSCILAWQAVMAAHSHRYVTEAVLRDFARLAAGEFVRRSTADIGFNAYYPLITAIRAATPPFPPGALPGTEAVAERLEERARPSLKLAGCFFRYDADLDKLSVGGSIDPPVREKLETELRALEARAASSEAPYTTVHAVVGDRAHSFVVTSLAQKSGAGRPAQVGFEVSLDALEPWFLRVFERAPLLPESLGGGRLTNEILSLRLEDAAGRERFRAGGEGWPDFTADVPYGDAYRGMFKGMHVHTSLDPKAAPLLVIGGLPRSRLPLLIALLALTGGFVAAGIFQLRRERALSALRSEFVSRVSHELRTPLTQIRMFAETLLLDRVRSEEERRRSLEILYREARRLGNLVESILQFSRGERGAIRLDPRPRHLVPLLRDWIDSFQPLARGARLVLDGSPDAAVAAVVDEDALHQMFLNLLDNAVKYGPEGQTIRVGTTRSGSHTRIWIADQGPGVPPGERERIWDSFQRLSRDEAAAIAGTGIGLSVVRDLAQLQGGSCWVEDSAGGGAQFVVQLPAPPEAVAEP
jgi:signal transduction histidine kinase